MIYLFIGDDTKNKHRAYKEFAKSLSKDSEIFFISKNEFNKSQIESFYSGAGLFFKKCNVVFTNVFEREEILDFVLEKLASFADSANTFVFLDGKIDKKVLEIFKKSGAKINNFDLPKENKEKFNNFILADDFGRKDRFNLWLHYRQAVDLGVGLEELVGVLFWKAKDMILKNNIGKFKKEELQNFTSKISYILPEVRKKGLDAEIELERFILSF